jgi:RecA/RadA recombinase
MPGLALAPALAPEPTLASTPDLAPEIQPRSEPLLDDRIIHTGFAALDAILGPGGLPRSASVAIRGDGSSGRTTLALRTAAEAQAQGSVVAWLDLSRSFDPVEAVARGVRLEWLVVITPASLDEGLSIAGSLLAGRSVDMLVLDLPGGRLARADKPAKIADRLHRLAALARRAETLLLILDAPTSAAGGRTGGLATAVAQSTGIRLELARRSWVRLGRDIVGQRTEAVVTHNRHGPPGRTATLRILYAEGGERDACLTHDTLLIDALDALEASSATTHETATAPAIPPPIHVIPHEAPDRKTTDHATSPSLRAAPSAGPGTGPTLRALPTGAARPGRQAMGPGTGHRRQSGRASPRRPARDAARERPSTRP